MGQHLMKFNHSFIKQYKGDNQMNSQLLKFGLLGKKGLMISIIPMMLMIATTFAGCYSPTTTASCGTGECLGSDGNCYGPCSSGYCTTSPSGTCSNPSAGGVYCCTSGGSGGSGTCTAQVCCGGLYECNGRCYSTCTYGSQPCCTTASCTCYTPCC